MNPFNIPGKPGNNADAKTVQLIVEGDGRLTPKQYGEVDKVFRGHLTTVRMSAAGFQVLDSNLPDGSRVRIVSNSGMHTIKVWPVMFKGERIELPHGLAARTNWHVPAILGYAAGTDTWAVYNEPAVLQLRDADPLSYNQVVRDGVPFVVLPMVNVDARGLLWDYAAHQVRRDYGTLAVPVNTSFEVEGSTRFYPHKYHFAALGKVKSLKGDVLHSMADGTPVGDEIASHLPANTDSNGSYVLLQAYRMAGTSDANPDLLVWRFWSEVLQRTGMEAYTLSVRKDADIHTPIGGSQTHTSTTTSLLGETISGLISTLYVAGDSGSVLDPDGHGHTVLYYMNIVSDTHTDDKTVLEDAYHRVVSDAANPPVIYNSLIALPAQASIEYAQLEIDFTYPSTQLWRGGYKQESFNISALPSGFRGWGKYRIRKERANSQHGMSGTPKATMHLGWTDIDAVNGTVTGSLSGRLYIDTEDSFKSSSEITIWEFMVAGGPYPGIGVTVEEKWADINGRDNMAAGIIGAWSAAPPNGAHIDVLVDDPVSNTGTYTITSRHVIDFDNRARFYAAIKVVLECSGATWSQRPSSYRGDLIATSDPTYDVKIYFESEWNGVNAEQLLVHASGAKPAFEFIQFHALNVYVYPGDDTTRPLNYYMPPEVSLGEDFMHSMLALAQHQGVNPHLAAADYRTGLPDGSDSPTGHELSYIDTTGGGASEKPHTKRALGQLYARTFKLSDGDIQKSLWLLKEMSISARLNNIDSNPVEWYYFPAIRAALDTEFHIEVRNGVIEQWSDTLPGTDAVPRPAPIDRDIKLYQV